MTGIETITKDGRLLAVIVSNKFSEPGIHFFTSHDLSQQLAYMRHPAGKEIPPHVHCLADGSLPPNPPDFLYPIDPLRRAI